MTDKEIIKALEVCMYGHECEGCPYIGKGLCSDKMKTDALDLINRQQAEIERLKKQLTFAEECIAEVEYASYKAGSNDRIDEAIEEYNNLVKVMTEGCENG